jgi:periplasmic divalent cation tolerance protein
LILFYCPCPSIDEAKKLAHALLEKKLIACANILPGMVSIYEWKGSLHDDSECLALFKTTKERAQEVETLLTSLHPYEIPAILQFEASKVNEDFFTHVRQSTLDNSHNA